MIIAALILAAPEAPRVYVVDPTVAGLPAALAATVSGAVAKAAADNGLQVMTRADAEEVLKRQIDLAQLGGDANNDALAALGQAVGAGNLLAATVSNVDGGTLVQLRLVDVASGKVLSRREAKTAEYGGELLPTVQAVTRLTLAPLFAHLVGSVRLEVSEADANVLVDDQQVGVTPVAAFELTGGTHLLTVTKEGFLRHQESVQISGGDVVQRMIRLQPSREFLSAYRSRNGMLRLLAWTTSALTVAGVGGTVALYSMVGAKNAENRELSAEFNALDPAEQFNRKAEYEARQTELNNDGDRLGFAATAVGVTTGIALVASVFFWLYGDAPDRYAEFEAVSSPAP